MDFYGFKPAEFSTIEYSYNADHVKVAEYKMCERDGYPYPCYFKFDLEGNILEVYPFYINSIKESLAIFKGEQPYKSGFNPKKAAYFSYEEGHTITDLYVELKGVTYKYQGKEVATSYFFFTLDEVDKYLSEEEKVLHYGWLASLDASSFILARKPDNSIYRFVSVKENELLLDRLLEFHKKLQQ